METILQKKLSIDKTKWTPVKFGEVVFEPKESSKDPVADGIKHVVGLEHIESKNIHLRKSETLEESTTFTKKFGIGDVLFGRRRAYLKKASQASFNGICSGDITVFRTKENLMPELLPFVVNNEKFFDYAIKHSAGGLSPRVKFKDLANYEFLLPPKDQQTQLAKLLWAMDEVIEKEKLTLLSNITLLKSIQKNLFLDSVKVKFTEEFEMLAGYSFKSADFTDKGFAVVKIKDIDEDSNIVKSEEITDFIKFDSKYDKYLLKENDILMGLTGAKSGNGYVGKLGVIKSQGKLYLNQRVAKIIPKRFPAVFTKLLLTSDIFLNEIWIRCNEGAQANISIEDIMKCPLPKVNANEVEKLEEKSKLIFSSIEANKLKIEYSKSLQKSLINQIF